MTAPTAPAGRLTAFAGNIWARRAAAVVVFAVAATVVYWGMHLPVALPVEDSKASWTLQAGDQVSLLSPTPGRVLSFRGPLGKGVALRFALAAPSAETVDGLKMLGLAVAPQPEDVQWITHDGGASWASVNIDLQPSGPHPALMVQLTNGDGVAEVSFQSRDAKLRVSMVSPLVGVDQPADITLGATLLSAGALPIDVDVSPGQPFILRFAQSTAGAARFNWGGLVNRLTKMTVLDLAGVRVQRQGETDRIYACGAGPRAVAWRTTKVEALPCQRTLRLQGLDLSREGGALTVIGSGFLVANGEPATLSWKTVTDNPVVSGLIGAAFAGLIGWILRMLLKAPAAVGEPPAPRRRGFRRKAAP